MRSERHIHSEHKKVTQQKISASQVELGNKIVVCLRKKPRKIVIWNRKNKN